MTFVYPPERVRVSLTEMLALISIMALSTRRDTASCNCPKVEAMNFVCLGEVGRGVMVGGMLVGTEIGA